jgi:hypothetical protein
LGNPALKLHRASFGCNPGDGGAGFVEEIGDSADSSAFTMYDLRLTRCDGVFSGAKILRMWLTSSVVAAAGEGRTPREGAGRDFGFTGRAGLIFGVKNISQLPWFS